MYYASEQAQKGSMLIEALVGALLMAILFVGLMSVFGRVLVSQRYLNVHNIALVQMRENLQTQGIENICSNSVTTINVAGNSLDMDAPVCISNTLTDVGVTGFLVDLPAGTVPATSISWSTAADGGNQDLVGGNGVLTISF